MSTAHTCFRSALRQAFRIPSTEIATSRSVSAFLIPALAPSSIRRFSSNNHHAKDQQETPSRPPQYERYSQKHGYPPRPSSQPLRSIIPIPPQDGRGDIHRWLEAIEPYLPSQLQSKPSSGSDLSAKVTAIDLAVVLKEAQEARVDLLGHLGLVDGRWSAVMWITTRLLEEGFGSLEPSTQPNHLDKTVWSRVGSLAIKDLTSRAIRFSKIQPSRRLTTTLDQITSAPDSIDERQKTMKRALGQLWRTLGSMILVAVEKGGEAESIIMSHVLQIIACLHREGFIPDSLYLHRQHSSTSALQQPPTLHLLSSQILTALSDAAWRAHELDVLSTKTRKKPSYFLGQEIPGSRRTIEVCSVSPELWLELVLWSCLHNGWTEDGVAILEQLAAQKQELAWGLISWPEIAQAGSTEVKSPFTIRALFSTNTTTPVRPEDRARTNRKISSEVVTAFVDGLVSQMRIGVGKRGMDPEVIVDKIKTLKALLDSRGLSLGSMAWDSVMSRLLESGGLVLESRPELMFSIFELACNFGTEVDSVNATGSADTELPYFFEPATLPLHLLHRTMKAFIKMGDVKSAISALMLLQKYTNDNKQKSVHQFFETLKNLPSHQRDLFTYGLPPVDYPAFDMQIPIPLLARLLDLMTDCKEYELGRSMLFLDDIDGPLVDPKVYNHQNIAPSIVRFGTLAGEDDLVMDIVEWSRRGGSNTQQLPIPDKLLSAMLCGQLQAQRWDSVEKTHQYIFRQSLFFIPETTIISTFAAELLRASEATDRTRRQIQEAFLKFVFDWESTILYHIRNDFYCIVAIMSSQNKEMKQFCAQLLAFSSRFNLTLPADHFNKLLGGVLDAKGSINGRLMVDAWCYKPPKTFEAYRAPGGLPTMPRFRLDKGAEREEQPEHIELIQASGAKLVFEGRISPNRQTIQMVICKVHDEREQLAKAGTELTSSQRRSMRKTLRWTASMLYYLGLNYDDVLREMGDMADLANLDAPPPVEQVEV